MLWRLSKIATQAQLGAMLTIDPTTLSRTLRPLLRQEMDRENSRIRPARAISAADGGGAKAIKESAAELVARSSAAAQRASATKNWTQLQSLLTKAVEAVQKA